MYSSRPPPPRMAAPEPASESGQPGPTQKIPLAPINPVWPMGIPHDKQRSGKAFPDLSICDFFNACNSEFSLETGRNAVLAGNRVLVHYRSLTNALHASQDHMMKKTDSLSKNRPILNSGDFFAYRFFRNTAPPRDPSAL